MAHPCKCVNCGRQFDRDKVPFIQVSSRRYAHKKCPDGPIDQIEVDKAINIYMFCTMENTIMQEQICLLKSM